MISFRNVTKAYGDFKAVDDISFDIQSHELFVIIGPSGSGKTTAMEMINRLTEMTSGEIYIDDLNIKDIDKVELRRSIGYVIQDVGLMPHMTISENISLVNRLKGKKKDEKRIDELLKLVNMDESFKERYPDELSGGQQQRIGVIRALYTDPNIILMDEAFSALDPVTRSQLQDEFIELHKNVNKTIVFVTHDMDEALKIANRIMILREGSIEQIGTPEELIYDPKNEFVRSFIGDKRRRNYIMENLKIKNLINEAYPLVTSESHDDIMTKMRDNRLSKLPVKENNEYYAYDLYRMLDGNFEKEDVKLLSINSNLNDIMDAFSNSDNELYVVIDENNDYKGVLDTAQLLDVLSTDREFGEENVE